MAEQNWCPATVSATTSVCATQQSNSPCPSPTCESCCSAASATTTSATQPSSPVSPPPAGPIFSAEKRCRCENQGRDEHSEFICILMWYYSVKAVEEAEAAAASPTPSSQPPLPSPILETQNFNARVETAIVSSTALIAQAELTAEELAEAERESAWNASYQQKEIAIACTSAGNQLLFHGEELATLLNDAEMGNLTVPDCDDLLTWNSNSGVDAKAECTGVSVYKLIAKFGS
jgi:hypothetical protein